MRGPDWSYEGSGRLVVQENPFQVVIRNAGRGLHKITACPKKPLLDSFGKPVKVEGDGCFTREIEIQ
jgi:hypothetical protein